MKKWLSIAAVVVLFLALVVGFGCGGEGEEEEEGVTTLEFGLGTPLTGLGAVLAGLPTKYATELAAEKIGVFEVAGKQYRWDIASEDNYCYTKPLEGGATSALRLIDSGVKIMHQSHVAPGLAAYPYCEESKVILGVGAVGVDQVTPDMRWMFIDSLVTHFWIAPLFDWLVKEHPEVKRVAGGIGEDILGDAFDDALRRCCEYYGLEYKRFPIPAETLEYYPIATSIMAYDPDMVYGYLFLEKPLWEMGYDGLLVDYYWGETIWGEVPWDEAVGTIILGPHPFGAAYPDIVPIKEEFEERYGIEFTQSCWMSFYLLEAFTQAMQKAGTVEDTERILEALETETFDVLGLGRVWYGGEELNGIGHCLVHEVPICMVTGESQYELKARYSAEEVEAISNEIYTTIK